MRFQVWAQTDVGLKREINQDSILVDHSLNLFIVADGMGGHKGGEVASAMAVEAAQEVIRRSSLGTKLTPKQVLQEAYREASSRIHSKSTDDSPDLMGMGTTMVLLWGVHDKVYIANVGDSRTYLYREGQLWQLTEDHSLINEQIRAGVISEEDAPHVVGRNVITRSVGFEKDVAVDVLEREFDARDFYLLCSDGLSGLVQAEELLDLFKKNSPHELVSDCIAAAKLAGGDDNVSVILVQPMRSY